MLQVTTQNICNKSNGNSKIKGDNKKCMINIKPSKIEKKCNEKYALKQSMTQWYQY